VVLAILSAAGVGAGPSRGLRTVSDPGHRAPSGDPLPCRTGQQRLAGAAPGTWAPTRRRQGLRPPPTRVGHRAERRSWGLQPTSHVRNQGVGRSFTRGWHRSSSAALTWRPWWRGRWRSPVRG